MRKKAVEPPAKKPTAVEVDDVDSAHISTAYGQVWVKFRSYQAVFFCLSYTERDAIVNGDKLSISIHIDYAQCISKFQFGTQNGFLSTLLQSTVPLQQPKIQTIHSRGDHWLVAATVFSKEDEVIVYDNSVDAQ